MEAEANELVAIDFFGGLYVRKEEFEVGGGYALDRFSVARIRIFRHDNQIVDNLAKMLVVAHCVHNGAEVIAVERPAADFKIFGHSWNIPPANKAVKAFNERGLVEDVGQFLEHILISVGVHRFFGDVAA